MDVLEERLRALTERVGRLEILLDDARNYKRNRNLALAGALVGVVGGIAAVILAAVLR